MIISPKPGLEIKGEKMKDDFGAAPAYGIGLRWGVLWDLQ